MDSVGQLFGLGVLSVMAAGASAIALSRSLWLLRTADARAREPAPPAWRRVWWLIRLIAVALRPLMSVRLGERTALRLRHAGLEFAIRPEDFIAGMVLCGLAGAMAAIGLASLLSSRVVVLVGGGVLAGAMVPVAWLRDRIQSRRRLVLRQLPFVLDLVTIAVEAGLSPSAAIAQAVALGPPGPMRDELARVLRDVKAGRSRDEAMRLMVERVGVPAVGGFAGAIGSVERSGASLARLLRAQSEQRRSERFLAAEKLAMEAPVKLLLPLVLFIFPGTFAIILFPIAAQMMDVATWR